MVVIFLVYFSLFIIQHIVLLNVTLLSFSIDMDIGQDMDEKLMSMGVFHDIFCLLG